MDPINFDSIPSFTTEAIHPMSTLGSSSSTVSQVVDNNLLFTKPLMLLMTKLLPIHEGYIKIA